MSRELDRLYAKHKSAVDALLSGYDGQPDDDVLPGFVRPDLCPDRPHRGPQGPNEDMSQCRRCLGLSWRLRPDGETFGYHDPDCSLPSRHESFCRPGGAGHEPARKIRG